MSENVRQEQPINLDTPTWGEARQRSDVMRRRTELCRLVFAFALVVASAKLEAQVLPSDTPESRNAGGRTSTLGPSPGAGSAPFSETPGDAAGVMMNRPGRPGPRIPAEITRPGRAFA